ncbi:hypothetical protein CROQUDRAFT_675031 [Cronartium quercuum f. sp. fusiforme G11]|uniref:Aldehyde dehydrogenase domain-containing protein n=1 Tax=Cronartium quercuum f. sp. fusiforme G11 TaxID=708437 RepID=A0A9P6T5A1_9BASI|nr:hypothetical protein CROQUDRAFT_675031 [Cronartium quercuum f. sp. fusiforme G11]
MAPRITLTFPSEINLKPVILETGLFINNEFVDAADQATLETVDPTNGKSLGFVSAAGKADVDRAVEAATKAFEEVWGLNTPGHQRGRLLIELAQAIEANADTIAAIESLDNGKAYSVARNMDIPEAANCLRYYGGWADKNHGKVIEVNDSKLAFTRHEPIGVVGQIIPWFVFTLLMLVWKIAPALATGNTIVIKPAEQTPLSALFVARLISNIFPPGVINIIVGVGKIAGEAISSHMHIEKIAFTGSTLVGKAIMKAAADSNLKEVTLELGGKSPAICSAGSRVYVHDSIYEKFITAIEAYTRSLKVGNPFDKDTFQGPQVSKVQFNRIMEYVKSGKDEGANCLLGGNRIGNEGYFIEPTIFTNVKPQMKIFREEIFGPVLVIMKFSNEDDIVNLANDTIYGLAAAVFTKDVNRALRVANRLQVGTVWVNCQTRIHSQMPFGGCKQSGFGRELGEYALSNYTSVKAVHVNLSETI